MESQNVRKCLPEHFSGESGTGTLYFRFQSGASKSKFILINSYLFWRASEQQLSWITGQKSVTLPFRCLNRFSRWDLLQQRNQEHPQARAAGVIFDNAIEINSLSVACGWNQLALVDTIFSGLSERLISFVWFCKLPRFLPWINKQMTEWCSSSLGREDYSPPCYLHRGDLLWSQVHL